MNIRMCDLPHSYTSQKKIQQERVATALEMSRRQQEQAADEEKAKNEDQEAKDAATAAEEEKREHAAQEKTAAEEGKKKKEVEDADAAAVAEEEKLEQAAAVVKEQAAAVVKEQEEVDIRKNAAEKAAEEAATAAAAAQKNKKEQASADAIAAAAAAEREKLEQEAAVEKQQEEAETRKKADAKAAEEYAAAAAAAEMEKRTLEQAAAVQKLQEEAEMRKAMILSKTCRPQISRSAAPAPLATTSPAAAPIPVAEERGHGSRVAVKRADNGNAVEMLFKVLWFVFVAVLRLTGAGLVVVLTCAVRMVHVFAPYVEQYVAPMLAALAAVMLTTWFAAALMTASMLSCAAVHLSPNTLSPLFCGPLTPLLSIPRAASSVVAHGAAAIALAGAVATRPGFPPAALGMSAFVVTCGHVWMAARHVSADEAGYYSAAEILSAHTVIVAAQIGQVWVLNQLSQKESLDDLASISAATTAGGVQVLQYAAGGALLLCVLMIKCAGELLGGVGVSSTCYLLTGAFLTGSELGLGIHSAAAVLWTSALQAPPGLPHGAVSMSAFLATLGMVLQAMRLVSSDEHPCCSALCVHILIATVQGGQAWAFRQMCAMHSTSLSTPISQTISSSAAVSCSGAGSTENAFKYAAGGALLLWMLMVKCSGEMLGGAGVSGVCAVLTGYLLTAEAVGLIVLWVSASAHSLAHFSHDLATLASVQVCVVSVCLSIFLSVRLSVCPSVCLSVCLSVYHSVCVCACVREREREYVYLCVRRACVRAYVRVFVTVYIPYSEPLRVLAGMLHMVFLLKCSCLRW